MLQTLPALATELKGSSSIRQGKVTSLQIGEVARFDSRKPTLVTDYVRGAYSMRMVDAKERFVVSTNIIALRKVIPYNTLCDNVLHEVVKDLKDSFAVHEAKTVHSIMHGREVQFSDDVKRLQKWFDNLGKDVLVLPREQELRVDTPNFHLVERTGISIETDDNPTQLSMTIGIWEDVGFFYELGGV